MTNKTMLTDHYQLTMNASYFDNKKDDPAIFDLFIRKLPQYWGYFIANGIEEAIDYATDIKFSAEDIEYLRSQGQFKDDFLEFLRDFKFEGDIYAVREGTPIAPNVPLLRVEGKRTQAQLLESTLLNIINFQTMIASKANRVVNAAQGKRIIDFGLRRAQGEDAAMKGARAAYIAGAAGTSNVKAGKEYGIPISGTQAHAFVMSFKEELEAFRAYAKTFPDKATLLIDTYNTVQGAKNAAIVAKELEKNGHKLNGVRIDSGDLIDLSKKVREILDGQGLHYVKIIASNDLNEFKIDELLRNEAPIDAFGVGTEMITAKPVAAIPGVYKLVEDGDGPKIKLSEDKKSYPGRKQIYRVGQDGKFHHDVLALEGEKVEGTPLLELVVKDGKRVAPRRTLEETRTYCLEQVAMLPDEYKQIRAEQYSADVSPGLQELVNDLTEQHLAVGGRQ